MLADGNATYTPGVSERRSGATTYLHGGLKSAELQTNSTQAVTSSKVFDAFGAELSSTGTWKGPSGYGGAFGYREDASPFKLLGHRLYDPIAGRFLSRDPIRDGRNWYAYCEGDPVNAADPTGLELIDDIRALYGREGARWFKDLDLDTIRQIHDDLKPYKKGGGGRQKDGEPTIRDNGDVPREDLPEVLDPYLPPHLKPKPVPAPEVEPVPGDGEEPGDVPNPDDDTVKLIAIGVLAVAALLIIIGTGGSAAPIIGGAAAAGLAITACPSTGSGDGGSIAIG